MASNVKSELCVCHFKDVESSDITKFSDASWNKFLASFEHWKDLDGVQKEICQKIKVIDPNWQNEHGYHRKCYQRFTDARSIARALKRSTKGTLKENFSDGPEDVLEFEPPAKRVLRSVTGSSDMLNLIRRNKHILPPICIICRRQKRINRFGKRDYARLISCETDCKKIIDAAKLKEDDAILLQLINHDPVSIELKYHKLCYNNYIKVGTKQQPKQKDQIYSLALENFCSKVIDRRIFNKQEVMWMKSLSSLFVEEVNVSEGIDASQYRNQNLKKRLQNKYGDQLSFLRPHPQMTELVMDSQHTETHKSCVLHAASTDSEESSSEYFEPQLHSTTGTGTYHLYYAAQDIRSMIEKCDSLKNWPPRAEDLTLDACKKVVPAGLFNFLAWCIGASNDICCDNFVNVACDVERKLLSLSQDIIFVASKGRKLLPKQLALGMTLRHKTGSSELIQLLNGFSQCMSHSVVLEYDTALALQSLEIDTIPVGFQKGVFTTLVWDNNDFGEETLSGEGIT